MKVDLRYLAPCIVRAWANYVREAVTDSRQCFFTAIALNTFLNDKVKGAQIVCSIDVIGVRVGVENAINSFYTVRYALVS
jgi:hypothetical protein